MNMKSFTASNSREAMALVRKAFGDDAVVLSNKPCADGVVVLAMAPEGMTQIERAHVTAPRVHSPARVQAQPQATAARPSAAAAPAAKNFAERTGQRTEPQFGQVATGSTLNEVSQDVQTLAMSTLSFRTMCASVCCVVGRRKSRDSGPGTC
ncbi:hypothetical protein ACVBEH_01430 [Roseateles sp. GG27B]